MGQQIIGTCKQCGAQNEDILPQMDMPKEIKNESIKQIREKLIDFESYAIQKMTTYSLKFDGLFRKQQIIKEKVFDSLGVIKPMDLEKVQQINADQEIKFRCALTLNDPIPITFQTLSGEEIKLDNPGYVLLKSWDLGEQAISFHQCTVISEIELIGLVRGNVDIYTKAIKTYEFQKFRHIHLPDDNIIDQYFEEETQEWHDHNYQLSALLLYDGVLIYKKYVNALYVKQEDSDTMKEILEIIENRTTQARPINIINNLSYITQEEYRKIKNFILKQKNTYKFSRNVEITVKKKTIYYKEEKHIFYEKPIFQINCSPKSLSVAQKFASQVEKPFVNWDSNLLKKKLTEKIKEFGLNVQVALEKDIVIQVSKQVCEIKIHFWEDGKLVPYYQDINYISQLKCWISASQQIKYEQNADIVQDRISFLINQLFQNFPKVDKVIGNKFTLIPYVERWKPPYTEFEEHQRNMEIHRRSDKILLLWLFDYEIEENITRLKELIQLKLANPQFGIQIVLLGYIKFTTWTTLFYEFMQKYDLNKYVIDSTIEAWFPEQEILGNFGFNVIMYKIFGLKLDEKDMMVIDHTGIVRLVEDSEYVVKSLLKEFEKFDQNFKIIPKNYNYWRQYQNLKKCIRENPNLDDIVKKIQQKNTSEESFVKFEQMKDKVWVFENGQIKEDKWHEQPTRILRNIVDYAEVNEMARIIAKYIDNNDVQPLK